MEPHEDHPDDDHPSKSLMELFRQGGSKRGGEFIPESFLSSERLQRRRFKGSSSRTPWAGTEDERSFAPLYRCILLVQVAAPLPASLAMVICPSELL